MFQNPVQVASHGADACPRFSRNIKELLLPNSVFKEIVLEVENLPSPQVGHSGFQCIVTIEGANLMVPARMELQHVVCDKTTVRLQLHDHIIITIDTLLCTECIKNSLMIKSNLNIFSVFL